MELAAVSPGSRSARILRAAAWSLVSGAGSYVLRMASSLVLTRLLVPEMFGITAIATMVQMICALLSDIGLREAIIQSKRGDDPTLLNTAWTIQVIRGFCIWLLCCAVAFGIYGGQALGWLSGDNVYSVGILPWVIAVTTISSIIGGFRPTKWITADRRLDLRIVTQIELYSQAVGLIFVAIVAWYTRSIWALVSGGLLTVLLSVWLSNRWLPGPSNRIEWDQDSIKELMGYGKWVLISSALHVLSSNGDRLLLGAWTSPAVLGFYVLALNISTIVTNLCERLFRSTAMPALSEIARESPKRFSALFRQMRYPFDAVCIGGAGALFALGQLVVDVLYDPRYQQAGTIIQILSFSLIVARYGICTSAYLALGHPKYLSALRMVKLLSLYLTAPIAHYAFGLMGALWAIALHEFITVPLYYWFNRRHRLDRMVDEVAAFAWWPIGLVAGTAFAQLVGRFSTGGL